MSRSRTPTDPHAEYTEAALACFDRQTLENKAKTSTQGQQQVYTITTLPLIGRDRPDVHLYSELLVQYRLKREEPIRQVVPDAFIVLHSGDLQVNLSYDVPLQPASLFLAMDCVSNFNRRKDYASHFNLFERELKIPYYLLFDTDTEQLTLYHRKRSRYSPSKPNERGRMVIPELELEVGLRDGWVRYWFRSELLLTAVEMLEVKRLLAEVDRLLGAG